MPVYSPINGSELEPTSIYNVYKDSIYGYEYIVNNGVVTKISSPATGGNLVRNSDGTYYDHYIGETFSFDGKRNAFIPHYIPDDTVEPAHIEGDYLIGNETGRRFEIDTNGRILTPEEIAFQARQGEDLARIARMEADGTIETYLDRAKDRADKVRQELEQKRQEGTLDEYFAEIINGKKKLDDKHILDDFATIIEHIGEQSVETLDELMSYFNAGIIKVGNRTIEAYSEPLIASKINARYRVFTGEDHPIFLERIVSVINSYMVSKEQLLKIGGYFNEQYFQELDNIRKYVNSVYSKAQSIDSIHVLREYHQSQGLEFTDSYYEMEELKQKAEKGEISTEDLQRLCDITFGVGTKESKLVYESMIQSGRVAPLEMEGATEKLR